MLGLQEQIGESTVASALARHGYLFLKAWQPEVSIFELACSIGAVVDVEKIAGSYRIGNVQTLKPRESDVSSPHSYSAVYGFNDFPLHTDYAHWGTPSRFLMLRCRTGDPSVSTYLLPSSCIADHASHIIDRAIVAPRRKHPAQAICPLAVRYRKAGQVGFRWDSLFLRPLNQAAEALAEVVKARARIDRIAVALSDPGDTLIIDNWNMLHGRSEVPQQGLGRHIERIYLSTLWELK
ncbi:TauD/TfdA family dioxygenase [Pseudomonas sp. LF19]|uniref:TauD/TfdA family dioxygenase n=1 Tax=Pseudomonas sp. LF19 TaxID=2899115 RepID=UPI001F370F14|nr:TauD/TfdA family dioxygenase [Pseudomonas sp. LF19]MCE5983731.1 TauD/TfdA family dioxygenase [Pseudomonas sp. LF19]